MKVSDNNVRTGISLLPFFVVTWPCRLYIDKSEGHRIQSTGPSVKTYLPAAEIYFPPSHLPSRFLLLSCSFRNIKYASRSCGRCDAIDFVSIPPGRSNLIWYQWWLNETSPGISGENGRRGEELMGFSSPRHPTCVVLLRHQRLI